MGGMRRTSRSGVEVVKCYSGILVLGDANVDRLHISHLMLDNLNIA